ncbi:MAG: DUF4956 domain-containing protein [Candidatus Absconditabacterales bacterium]
MENFIQSITSIQDLTGTFSVMDIMVGILLSFILTACIGWVYKKTHRGTSYTQSYVQTLVIMAMIVSVIMLIVGSNIARAFSLVGALSIIRFRNAMKETRDIGFMFLAMAIGMATGTKFYLLAIVATVAICLVIVIMNRFDRYGRKATSKILKIQVQNNAEFDHLFDDIFVKYTSLSDLISIDSIRGGALTELVYNVNLKDEKKKQEFLTEIKQMNGNLNVTLITGYNTTDL